MIKKIITINSRGEGGEVEFDNIFKKAAAEMNIEMESILSKDCFFLTDFNQREYPTKIIHQGVVLQQKGTGFYIKSYRGNSHLTYLIGKIISLNHILFSDEANLQHSNRADKISMTALLPLYGIRVPDSIICTEATFVTNRDWILRQIKFPCVIKKSGSKGKRVWKVNNESELNEKISIDAELAIIQDYLPNDHDFRVFVQDGKILASIKRNTADGFYNNVSQGGKAESAEITDEEAAICIKAAEIAGLRLAGVDLLRHQGETYVLEVNKNPQIVLFNEVTNGTLATTISKHIINDLSDALGNLR